MGSAYGKDGLPGRWRAYADDPSGNNKHLIKLIQEDPQAPFYFQFTILRTLLKQ